MGTDPDAWRLAVLGSLASRLEPQLLRRLRLALAPGLDAAAEVALWFSNLVATRAATGLVLAPETLPALRAELAAEPETLEAAWRLTAEAHLRAPPALLAEEELTYLALKGLEAPEVATRARTLLRQTVRTMVDRQGSLAAWADRAVPRMPPVLRAFEETRMVAHAAALRLGRAGPLTAVVETGGKQQDWSWLAPDRLRRLSLTLRWVEGGIEFGPPGAAEGHAIDVPELLPLTVQVWPGGEEAGSGLTVPLRPPQISFVPVPQNRITVQILGGARLELVRDDVRPASYRTRKPQTHVTYEVEMEGSIESRELPFVIGILADLLGDASPADPLPDRKFRHIDRDNFDVLMERMEPRLLLSLPSFNAPTASTGIELTFRSMLDFEPDQLVLKIPTTAAALKDRTALRDLGSVMDRSEAVEDIVGTVLADRARLEVLRQHAAGPTPSPDLAALTNQVVEAGRIRDPSRAADMLRALLVRSDRSTDIHDPLRWLQNAIAAIDTEISAELIPVLHHPKFQQLEGTWRGLHYMVHAAETGPNLKLRFLPITKPEMLRDLAASSPKETELYRKIFDYEFGMMGGEPYGALLADYQWDDTPANLQGLAQLARLGETALVPVLTGAAPSLLGLERWADLAGVRDLQREQERASMQAWLNLRDTSESRFLTLAMPRVLTRLPYGTATRPVEAFDFEEIPAGRAPSIEAYCWMNAAYTLAGRLMRAIAEENWCVSIHGVENGGKVENLPVHYFANDSGEADALCPTEIGITDRREAELMRMGFTPLCHYRNTDYAVFFAASTAHRLDLSVSDPQRGGESLPAMLAAGRFMHYLLAIARDKLGSFMGAEDLKAYLGRWVQNYVSADEKADTKHRSRFPLRDARVDVRGSGRAVQLSADFRVWLPFDSATGWIRLSATSADET